MSKSILKSIDGKGIMNGLKAIIDYAKYRKYSTKGFATVVRINGNDNEIQIHKGVEIDGKLQIPKLDETYLPAKKYMLPTKRLVTACFIVKEGVDASIDIDVPPNVKDNKILLNKLVEIKLLDEFGATNVGQILLGLFMGIVVGIFGIKLFEMVLMMFM